MADKAAALKAKLANLKRKRQDAISANHKDVSFFSVFWLKLLFIRINYPKEFYFELKRKIKVVEEDRVAKLPTNFEARKERAEYILNEMNEKESIEADGNFVLFFDFLVEIWSFICDIRILSEFTCIY